jgi:hypothetical protein
VSERLVPHPAEAAQPAVLALEAHVELGPAETLRFEYRLTGDLARLAIPRKAPSQRADRLWERTCFEAFVAAAGADGYYELNFSPSSEWAAYAFDAYRQGMRPLELAQPPRIEIVERANELRVTAAVEIGALSAAPWPRRVGLAAVVADLAGERGYYAVRHPREKPDFHDAASFTVLLDGSSR